MLNGFGTVVNSLKMRAKPYLPQICGTIKWRLNNKSAKIRQQAADLIARIAVVMKVCSCAGLVQHGSGSQQHMSPLLLALSRKALLRCYEAVLLRPVSIRRPAVLMSRGGAKILQADFSVVEPDPQHLPQVARMHA